MRSASELERERRVHVCRFVIGTSVRLGGYPGPAPGAWRCRPPRGTPVRAAAAGALMATVPAPRYLRACGGREAGRTCGRGPRMRRRRGELRARTPVVCTQKRRRKNEN